MHASEERAASSGQAEQVRLQVSTVTWASPASLGVEEGGPFIPSLVICSVSAS